MDWKLAIELGRWTVIAVSVITVIGFLWNIQTSVNSLHTHLNAVNAGLTAVQRDIGDLRERMARVEVKLDSHLALPHGPAPEPQ